ncbi:MAG: HlyD family secretion protein, partial [Cellvibrionales bacterium]|nr:HlyD family secretion protein [Cellvibrionales bacterium]
LDKEINDVELSRDNFISRLNSISHEIASLENELEGLQFQLNFYKENYEKEEKLLKKGLISEVTFKNTHTAYNLKAAEVAALKSSISKIKYLKMAENTAVKKEDNRLNELRATREMQIKQQQLKLELAASRIQSVKSSLEKSKIDYSRTNIIAKRSGQVTNRRISEGDYVEIGQPIASIVSCSENYWVRANFKETQVERMKVGDKAVFTIDTYPGVEFEGVVEGISSGSGSTFSVIPPENATGNFTKVVKRIPVKIKVHNANDHVMRIGTSAYVTVHFDDTANI